MKLTHQDMLKNFNFKYTCHNFTSAVASPSYIIETFDLATSNRDFKEERNLEDALTKLKKLTSEDKDMELIFIEKSKQKSKQRFNDLSFLGKMNWKIRNKDVQLDLSAQKSKEYCEDLYKQKIENIDVRLIDESRTYIINCPEILKKGDILYLVVTNESLIKPGIYEATVKEANYFERSPGIIDLNARMSIIENGKEEIMNFSSNEANFLTYHSHHYIFKDLENAVKFSSDNINERIKDIESRIVNSFRQNSDKPNIRPNI